MSLIGTWVQMTAQSWLVFELTHSAFLLGLVGFLGSIPIFVLSLFAGVVADRTNKKHILVITQTIFMALALALAVLTQFKIVTPAHIMLIAVLSGTVMAFDAPARQALIVDLVGKKHLFNAIALNSVSFNSSRIIGPALAGIMVSGIGMAGCFYTNAISFLAVLFALLSIKLNYLPRSDKHNSKIKDLKDGLVFIRSHRIIMSLIFMVGISSLFGISYNILMPIFANDVLHVGVKGLGVLMSASGAGALIAALILARLGDFKFKGRLLVGSSIVFSFALILFALSKVYLFSVLILVIIGGSSVMAMALINTLLQTNVTDAYRGRVMSVFMFTFAGFMPFGSLLAGSLSQSIGVRPTVMLSGGICAISFIIMNALIPSLREL